METPQLEITEESFYSGHNGTTKTEIYLLIGVYPSSLLFFSLVHLLVPIASFPKKIWSTVILEFSLLVFPVILAFTVLCDHVWRLLSTQFAISVVLFILVVLRESNPRIIQNGTSYQDMQISEKRRFLTHLRVFINIATTICILAVDFKVFPRRFAKSETYGTGLMDVGVGLFVIGNALVAPETRGTTASKSSGRSYTSGVRDVFHTVLSCSPLLVLGVLRLLSVKAVNYHEHVSEYGVHWNFFFTLAAVRILVTITFAVFPVTWSGPMATLLSVCYQYLLNMHGLEEYVLHGSDGQGSRNGILEANREGIFSCIGYCAIYMAGVSIGSFIFQIRSTVSDWTTCLFKLMLCNGILVLASIGCNQIMDPVSRRLANLPYIFWIVTSCINCLIVLLSLEIFLTVVVFKKGSPGEGMVPTFASGPSRGKLRRTTKNIGRDEKQNHLVPPLPGTPHPLIIVAISKNQLFNFLLANLLTGSVNMSINTISTTHGVGFAIVGAYTFILCLVMVAFYTKNINTKFW